MGELRNQKPVDKILEPKRENGDVSFSKVSPSKVTLIPSKQIETVDTLLDGILQNFKQTSLSCSSESKIPSSSTTIASSSSHSINSIEINSRHDSIDFAEIKSNNNSIDSKSKHESISSKRLTDESPLPPVSPLPNTKPILKKEKSKGKSSHNRSVQFSPDTKPVPKLDKVSQKDSLFEQMVQMDVVERQCEDSDASLTDENHKGPKDSPFVNLKGKKKVNVKKRNEDDGVSMTFLPGAFKKETPSLDDIEIHEHYDDHEENRDDEASDSYSVHDWSDSEREKNEFGKDYSDLAEEDTYSTDCNTSDEDSLVVLPPLSLFGTVWTLLNEITTKKTNEYVATRISTAATVYQKKELKNRNDPVYQIFNKQVSSQ